ncbi:hypothetical protein PHET_01474 [Paragonimus heterotremus]|uniref:Uncharacterized protein n=1 Tax=Paragonimus heterotremus TaxID=100268 RepID=A0A8J4TE30_9TREM|nr:hypothetical protein PHET_01474 [Paragonimus heterotremus]
MADELNTPNCELGRLHSVLPPKISSNPFSLSMELPFSGAWLPEFAISLRLKVNLIGAGANQSSATVAMTTWYEKHLYSMREPRLENHSERTSLGDFREKLINITGLAPGHVLTLFVDNLVYTGSALDPTIVAVILVGMALIATNVGSTRVAYMEVAHGIEQLTHSSLSPANVILDGVGCFATLHWTIAGHIHIFVETTDNVSTLGIPMNSFIDACVNLVSKAKTVK